MRFEHHVTARVVTRLLAISALCFYGHPLAAREVPSHDANSAAPFDGVRAGMPPERAADSGVAQRQAPPGVHIEAPIGRVTVARAADIVGRPIYPTRRAGARQASVVTFHDQPVRVSASQTFRASAMPLSNTVVTSGFGARRHPIYGVARGHAGVDLAAPFGAPIKAASDGTISRAQWAGGYGLLVALEHGEGVQTRYAHMSRIAVAEGQAVRKGDILGYVGSSGLSTGPHLHFEWRVNGQAVNPLGQ